MKTRARLLAAGASAAAIGILSVALAQPPVEDPETIIERRLFEIEVSLANLDNLVRRRTDTVGIDDRYSRDNDFETRFREIERQLQQMTFTLNDVQRQASDAQRQVSDAMRIASQAQSDAQFAQQIARDAQARVQ